MEDWEYPRSFTSDIDSHSFVNEERYKNIGYQALVDLYGRKFPGAEAIIAASEKGNISDVLHFIKLKKEHNISGRLPESRWYEQITSYVTSFFWNPYYTVKEMIDYMGNDIRRDKSTSLLKTVENGHALLMTILLDNGADVNIEDDDNMTVLHKAMHFEYPVTYRLLKTLLKHPDMLEETKNTLNRRRSTPLDYAYLIDEYGTLGWRDLLKYYGCKANKWDSDGNYVGPGFGELKAKVMVVAKSYKLGFFRQKKLWPTGLPKYKAIDAAGFNIPGGDNYVKCIPCKHIFAATHLYDWLTTIDSHNEKKNTCPHCRGVIQETWWLNDEDSRQQENKLAVGHGWNFRWTEKNKPILKF